MWRGMPVHKSSYSEHFPKAGACSKILPLDYTKFPFTFYWKCNVTLWQINSDSSFLSSLCSALFPLWSPLMPSSLLSTLPSLCYYKPLRGKSLSCLCHPLNLLPLLLLSYFSSSSSSSSPLYIYFLKFYLCLYLIWEKHFEGRVFDQQNTKQHWSTAKNHQVPPEILKYLLKNFQICEWFIYSC